MRARGATTFVCKPFRTGGRTLDRVIKKIVSGQSEQVGLPRKRPMPRKEGKPQPSKTTSIVPLGPTPEVLKKTVSLLQDRPKPPAPPTAGTAPTGALEGWASVPNEPVELDDFMAKFCEQRTKENRMCRKRALLAAARHEPVKLPPLAAPPKHGQSNEYLTRDLLAAWQGYLDEGVDLPPLRT